MRERQQAMLLAASESIQGAATAALELGDATRQAEAQAAAHACDVLRRLLDRESRLHARILLLIIIE